MDMQLEWCSFKIGKLWDFGKDPCQVMSTSVQSIDDVIDISAMQKETEVKSKSKGSDFEQGHKSERRLVN